MSQIKNVDITPGTRPTPQVNASQGDVGRTFVFKLYDGPDAYDLTDLTVTWAGTKPSGLGFTLTATVSDNAATFVSTEDMTDEHGSILTEIKITNDDDLTIGTENVILVVEKNPHPDSTTDGSAGEVISEMTLLVERIEAAAASIQDLSVEAETLSYGDDATATYDSDTNTITFGIPSGGAMTATDEDSDGNIVITFE